MFLFLSVPCTAALWGIYYKDLNVTLSPPLPANRGGRGTGGEEEEMENLGRQQNMPKYFQTSQGKSD